MANEIRIGVIGVGGRGSLAGNAHQPEQGVRLVAGADVNAHFLESFQGKYGLDTFVTNDYRQLLARQDIDAVFITSPDFCHEEHAVAALSAGKAVYLEKPMAITIEGCDHILQAARDHKTKLYVGHNMRHFAVVRKMKELIDAGAIGQVKAGWCRHFVSYGGDAYFKDWHAERRLATGLLLQKGAHDIDVLHWLCGGYSQRVTAMGNLGVYNRLPGRGQRGSGDRAEWTTLWPPAAQINLNERMDVEDLSMMLMELDNGVLASYQQCHYAPDCWRNYTILGDRGRIENYGDAPGQASVQLWNTRNDSFRPQGDEQFVIEKVEGSHGGADPLIVADFIGFLRGGRPQTSPVAARYSVAAGCQATASLRSGSQPLPVPPLPPDLRAYFE